MQLVLKDNDTVKCLQDNFNKAFPYLWIEFSVYEFKGMQSSLDKINPLTVLRDISTLKGTRLINIDGKRSVAELEKDFSEILALKVKVYRKSGNVWVGTSYTVNWTLENQNSEGQQIVID